MTDHQGSILALYKLDFTTTYTASYDVWGKRTVTKNNISFQRGYTGHEHWDSFQLIDMNGRFYDPILGRFLSPDPYVQAPDNTQSFNRYSYCLNNPLKYTDPSGEYWGMVIGVAAIGGFINWAAHGCKFTKKGLGYFGTGFVAGAASAVTCGGISSALAGTGFSAGFLGSSAAAVATSSFKSGLLIGGAGGAISGSVTGFGNTLLNGGSIREAVDNMHLYGGIGAVSGAVIGGVTGMTNAYLDNRNVWNGDEIAMGRSAFSFNNTDLDYNSYMTKEGVTYHKSYVDNQMFSDRHRYDEIKYGHVIDEYGNSANGLSKVQNYTYENAERKISSAFIGRAKMTIDKTSLNLNYTIKIDGVVVVPDINGVLYIPQGAKIMSIQVLRDRSIMTTHPIFKYIVQGVSKHMTR